MSDHPDETEVPGDGAEPGRTTPFVRSPEETTDATPNDEADFVARTTILPSDGPATWKSGGATDDESPSFPEVPGYAVQSVLGRGGMGVVYRATDEELGRTVALKMLTGADFAGRAERVRFETEARSIASIQHENVVGVYEVGSVEERPYLVLEFAGGGSLRDRTHREPQPPDEATRTLVRLARGVQACHDAGVVHRDLKPANVLVTDDGTLKITDFGLAKLLDRDEGDALTRTGEVMGTPSYMAPEQATGLGDVGRACDVYALGAILYELLAGRPPFVGPDALAVVRQVARDEPVSPRRLQPTVPRDLETICLKCLEKSPERRYASAAALADDLERHLAGEPIQARPVGPAERTWKWCRRRPTAAALIATSTLAVAVFVVGSLVYNAKLDTANENLQGTIADRDAANRALKSTNEALEAELERSREVVEQGNELANWLLLDHVEGVSRLRGSSPVQKALLDRLRGYLDGLSEQIRDDETRLEQLNAADIGRAYERIAEVQGHPSHVNLGSTNDAVESYRRAEEIWKRLVAEAPDDSERRYHLAGLRSKLADVLLRQASLDEAERLYQQQLDVCDTLAEERADDARFGEFRVFLLVGLGDVAAARNEQKAALAKYEQALVEAEKAEKHSDATDDAEGVVALAASRIGATHEALGDLDEAARQYQVALEHHRDLHELRPNDSVVQQGFAKALRKLGDLETRRGEYEPSLATYQRAEDLVDDLVAADPGNAALRREKLIMLERIALPAMMLERFDLAESSMRSAIQLVDELATGDPDNVELQRSRWIQRDKLGSVLLQSGRADEAERFVHEHLELASALVEKHGLPDDRQGVAQANLNLGVLTVGRLDLVNGAPSDTKAIASTAIEHFANGIAQFDAIAEDGELNADQAALRATLVKMRDTVVELLESVKNVQE